MSIMADFFSIFLNLLLAVQASVALAAVTWDSPAVGDVYIPGDTLQAVWTSAEKMDSPSFTICAVDNSTNATSNGSDCGTAVWPPIDQNGTEYSISLAVPNITGDGNYYLLMKDDRGTTYDTPNFSLALTRVSNATASTNVPSVLDPAEPSSTSIEYLPSHSAPTIAAIAIPLSLVAATLIVALIMLLCRMRRSRQRERNKPRESTASDKFNSEQGNISFASATDIERAVLALAAARGYGALGPQVYPQQQQHLGMNPGHSGPNFGAAAAAALGLGAFGWAHGFGLAPPAAHGYPDAYTPAPVPHFVTNPGIGTVNQQHGIHTAPLPAAPLSLQAQPEKVRYVNADEAVADDAVSTQPRGPPQLPEIQLHTSSPPLHVQDSPPPPLPPKQLYPGSSLGPASYVYDPPYLSQTSASTSTSAPPSTPGTNAHTSLNVISDYMHASPTLPQNSSHLAPPPNDFHAPRPPLPSLIRARSLRRLETVPETEKPLPSQPEEHIGTDLYNAVSRAVGR